MRWNVVLGSVLSSLITQRILSPVYGTEGGDCSSRWDCDHEECCNYKDGFGTCQHMGRAGDKCLPNEGFHHNDLYFYTCPCIEGYDCKGENITEIPYGEIGACEKRPQFCTSGDDCAEDECCLASITIVGRKKRASHNVCHKLGGPDSRCLVALGSGKTRRVVFECPCKHGLACHPTEHFDIPLGALGMCELLH